jgi:hypothetical protein
MPYIGFKALPAGYTAASSLDANNTSAKGVSSGTYVWWEDPNALAVASQTAPANAASFFSIEDCTRACDFDRTCAGVTLQQTVDVGAVASTCKLVQGDDYPGRFIRTVVRVDMDQTNFPAALPCPSGYVSTNETGTAGCVKDTNSQLLTWKLIGQGSCDAATVASVRTAVTSYLSSPLTAYGVFAPSLVIGVGCLEVSVAALHGLFLWLSLRP